MVVAHQERATLRVGDVFVKVDSDQTRTDVEIRAMSLAPVPTPEVLWRRPPVLALAALWGRRWGASAGRRPRRRRRGPPREPPYAHARRAVASVVGAEPAGAELEPRGRVRVAPGERVLPPDLVVRNREAAQAALRPWTPVFVHGDLQVAHVFVDGDEIPVCSTGQKRVRAMPCATSPA